MSINFSPRKLRVIMENTDLLEGQVKDFIWSPAKLPFKYDALEPVISDTSMTMHFRLHKNYVKVADETNNEFHVAGAVLHEMLWGNLCEPGTSKCNGKVRELIEKRYGSLDYFKGEFTDAALEIHGSGWVAMKRNGDIITIENHKLIKNLALVVDMWEHAYMFEYLTNKEKYLKNIWRIINWDVVSERI